MCYKKLGNYEESVKDYTNAIRLESNNGNFYYNRAISYMLLNPPDYEKALEDYDLAVNHMPTNKYRPLFNRGNCLRKMGRIAESIVDLKQAVFPTSRAMSAHALCNAACVQVGLETPGNRALFSDQPVPNSRFAQPLCNAHEP